MMIIQLSHLPLDQDHASAGANDRVHFIGIIIARRTVDSHIGAFEFLIRKIHPLLNDFQNFREKDGADSVRVFLQLGNFIWIGHVGIIAAAADTLGKVGEFVFVRNFKHLFEQSDAVIFSTLMYERDDCLARHVAAEN